MFVIISNYKVSAETIDKYLLEHRAYLAECYKNNFFIVAGPRNPRIGGLVISQLNDRKQLENIIKNDPFIIHDFVNYEIIEFNPVKYHKDFSAFMGVIN